MNELFLNRAKNVVALVKSGEANAEAKVAEIMVDVHKSAIEGVAESLFKRGAKFAQEEKMQEANTFNNLAALVRTFKNPNAAKL